MERVPAQGRKWNEMIFKHISNPNHPDSVISMGHPMPPTSLECSDGARQLCSPVALAGKKWDTPPQLSAPHHPSPLSLCPRAPCTPAHRGLLCNSPYNAKVNKGCKRIISGGPEKPLPAHGLRVPPVAGTIHCQRRAGEELSFS